MTPELKDYDATKPSDWTSRSLLSLTHCSSILCNSECL